MDGKVSDSDKNSVCYVYKGWDLLVCEVFAFKVDNFRPNRHLQNGVTSLVMNIFA